MQKHTVLTRIKSVHFHRHHIISSDDGSISFRTHIENVSADSVTNSFLILDHFWKNHFRQLRKNRCKIIVSSGLQALKWVTTYFSGKVLNYFSRNPLVYLNRTAANDSSHLALLKTEKRLFKENILSAVISNPNFIKDDYLGAFQIFKIAKFSKSDEPSDDDKDFWCPLFETITPLKIGFLVN